jgi:autotransporter translocation and assembly factor TamB
MRILKFTIKTILFLAILGLGPILVLTTNSGLNIALTVGSWFSPFKVSYGSVSGTIIGPTIEIHKIKVQQNEHILQVSSLKLNWRAKSFSAHQVLGFEAFLPANDFLASGKPSFIHQINGVVDYRSSLKGLDLNIDGEWQAEKLKAKINASHDSKSWHLQSANVQIGANSFKLDARASDDYDFELNIPHAKSLLKDGYGALNANGRITNSQGVPEVSAKLVADDFGFRDYAFKKLQAMVNFKDQANAPLKITASAAKLEAAGKMLTAFKLEVNGSLDKHLVQGSTYYAKQPIKITAQGSFNGDLWQTKNLLLGYQAESLHGSAYYNVAKSTAELKLQGKILSIATDLEAAFTAPSKAELKLNLHANPQNKLQANIKLNNNKLAGELNAQAEDLSWIMQQLPDVTRLKGLFIAKAKLSGTIDKPILLADAHVTKITATIPGLGVKIKPMELHITSDADGKLIINGNGKMRRGPGDFRIHGFIEALKPDMPNRIYLTANKLEFVNNDSAHLLASAKLEFSYLKAVSRLDIDGDIDIQEGNIYFDPKKTNTVKSKDVIFIDEKDHLKDELLINPTLNLRISDGVHFTGFNLDADITGKLDISQRHKSIYSTGRVTIKEGTYQLPGQRLKIQKGRLLYPPGTLLVNPALDIKMMSTIQLQDQKGSDLQIFVHGNAQNPVINESGIGKNSDKAMSQALMAGSSLLSKNFLQDKLKLSELGITNHDDQQHPDFFDPRHKNPSTMKNKDLIVGRPLGNKLYLQYLHSMGEANSRVRLKYALNKVWSLGFESGQKGGGADLSFAIEKD